MEASLTCFDLGKLLGPFGSNVCPDPKNFLDSSDGVYDCGRVLAIPAASNDARGLLEQFLDESLGRSDLHVLFELAAPHVHHALQPLGLGSALLPARLCTLPDLFEGLDRGQDL